MQAGAELQGGRGEGGREERNIREGAGRDQGGREKGGREEKNSKEGARREQGGRERGWGEGEGREIKKGREQGGSGREREQGGAFLPYQPSGGSRQGCGTSPLTHHTVQSKTPHWPV